MAATLIGGDRSTEMPADPAVKADGVQMPLLMGFLAGVPQPSRKEKRKFLKKMKRKQLRQQVAEEAKLEEYGRLDDEAEQLRIELEEQINAEQVAGDKAEHDEQERLWIEREKIAMEEFERRQEELKKIEEERKPEGVEEDDGTVDDDGPAEIIWKGNEIIVKKRRVKTDPESNASPALKDASNSASNPLPPQSAAFAAHNKRPQTPDVTEQTPSFGTEQDKTNCPFHIKTGVCRFGVRCSRVHVYPHQSFTLLMRNMYTGPGLTWDNEEGLETSRNTSNKIFQEDGKRFGWRYEGKGAIIVHSDEEVAQQFEEFFEDVHSEFIQFGELVNFKVCQNGSSHLRGNVYVHYKSEAAAQAAYSGLNGRFYASKQITCEFVGVTRWRVALCGEFMKGNHKLCSHGTACNFLHCFRNPNGEYDWANWDAAPPRYWAIKMAKLFGYEPDLEREYDDRHDDYQSRHGYLRSPSRRKSRRRDNYHSSNRRDDSERALSDRRNRRHEIRGERYRSNSDDTEEPARNRSRDSNCLSSSRAGDERQRPNGKVSFRGSHLNEEDATGCDYLLIDRQKKRKDHRNPSPRNRDAKEGSSGHEALGVEVDHIYARRSTEEKSNKYYKRHTRSEDLRNSDDRRSVDFESSRVRCRRSTSSEMERNSYDRRSVDDKGGRVRHRRSTSSDMERNSDARRSVDYESRRIRYRRSASSDVESNSDDIGPESSFSAGGYRFRSKAELDNNLVHVVGKKKTIRNSDDAGSIDIDSTRGGKRCRSDHQRVSDGKRSSRKKSRAQNIDHSSINEIDSPDVDNRWTGICEL